MQTQNTAVAELTTIIAGIDAGREDEINEILSQYPAVWYTLFNDGKSDDGSIWTDADLTQQATDAAADLAERG